MKKRYKVIIGLLVIVIVVFVIFSLSIFTYSRILQAHADEGGRIFDYRCNNVNPALIAYKNSYLQMWNLMKNKGSESDVMSKMADYTDGIKKYIPLEDMWLKKDSAFINRWDFQLFEPDYVKNLAKLQFNMYQAQKDDAMFISNLFANPSNAPNTTDKSVAVAQKLHDASNAYFTAYDAANKKVDWKKLLWREPAVNCPEQNLHIPDTDINTIFATPIPTPVTAPNGNTSPTS